MIANGRSWLAAPHGDTEHARGGHTQTGPILVRDPESSEHRDPTVNAREQYRNLACGPAHDGEKEIMHHSPGAGEQNYRENKLVARPENSLGAAAPVGPPILGAAE
eukprot:3636596-Lingulodinium_polyedra.AAC.1